MSDHSARLIFGEQIPHEVKRAARKAITYYPELSETTIEFSVKSNIVNSFMQAQPKWNFIFKSRAKRTYRINMVDSLEVGNESIPIGELPEGVLIGWLVHELGHIMDYYDRSNLQMIGFGIRYLLSSDFKTKAEHRADIYAIEHGTADYIIITKNFILHEANLPQFYKDKIRKLYMSPEEVMEKVEELEKAG